MIIVLSAAPQSSGCVPNREYCQQKKPKSAPHQQTTMVDILFMFSFGVAKPRRSFFRLLRGKQTPIWHEKRSTLWPENEFFKSKMDALTVLSIWDTVIGLSQVNVHALQLLRAALIIEVQR